MTTTTTQNAATTRKANVQLLAKTETKRARRGHRFYPTLAELKKMPTSIEDVTTETPVLVHYFGSSYDAYVVAIEEDGNTAFAYVKFAHMPEGAEWGYIPLNQLETLQVGMFTLIERDLNWEPKTLSEALKVGA